MATAKLVTPACPFSLSEVKGNRSKFKCMSNANGGGSRYRPALILPGLGNNSSDYQQLASSLEAKGVRTVVAKVSRPDWLRNAAGLLDGNYWKGTLRPRPVLDWYLKIIEDTISTAQQLADGGKISLIGHSAGGWLARVYLAEYGFDGISLLLTLGTPHLPAPKGVPGVIDQTRGLLDYVEKYCPVSSYASELKVVCIAGRYVKGERIFENQSIKLSSSSMKTVADVDGNLIVKPNEGTIEAIDNDTDESSSNQLSSSRLRALIVGQGYKQVCGKANVWGDGVVPEVSAHLEGAKNITLEGVYHSPVGADDISRPWYGSNAVLDKMCPLAESLSSKDKPEEVGEIQIPYTQDDPSMYEGQLLQYTFPPDMTYTSMGTPDYTQFDPSMIEGQHFQYTFPPDRTHTSVGIPYQSSDIH